MRLIIAGSRWGKKARACSSSMMSQDLQAKKDERENGAVYPRRMKLEEK